MFKHVYVSKELEMWIRILDHLLILGINNTNNRGLG